jgi:hypothetical protein
LLRRRSFADNGRVFTLVDGLDRNDEPIAAPRQRLDEPGSVGGVPQRLADPAYAEVEPLLEVHDRVAQPDVRAKLFACNDFAGTARKELEHLERLRRQLDDVAAPAKLAGGGIELERTEPEHLAAAHEKLIPNSSPVHGVGP